MKNINHSFLIKLIMLLLAVTLSTSMYGNNNIVPLNSTSIKSITITDDYDCVYCMRIVNTKCSDKMPHGPISVTDRLTIDNIVTLFNKSEVLLDNRSQDIFCKVKFHLPDTIFTLCLNYKGCMFLNNGITYKHNRELNECIIKLIEASGISEPGPIVPPDYFYNVIIRGTVLHKLTKQPYAGLKIIIENQQVDFNMTKVTKELTVNNQGGIWSNFEHGKQLIIKYIINDSLLEEEIIKLDTSIVDIKKLF